MHATKWQHPMRQQCLESPENAVSAIVRHVLNPILDAP